MKRIFMLLTISITILLGLAACSETDTSEDVKHTDHKEELAKKETKDEKVAEANAESVKDVPLTPPTERTEPIADGKYPWEVYEFYGSEDAIQERVQNGEVVFLWSDAEALENDLVDFSKGNSDKPAEWWHSMVTYFNSQVGTEYPDKAKYFEKMKEIEGVLFRKEKSQLPILINEAKELRGV